MALLKKSLPGIVFCTVFICLMFPACGRTGLTPDNAGQSKGSHFQEHFPVFTSYKDIPGVTPEEIDAIEKFRRQGRSFVYGACLDSECFIDNGQMDGFGVLFCKWLGDLFDLRFTPVIYEWTDLLDGLETGKIDFTGELNYTKEGFDNYIMTSAIAQRPINMGDGFIRNEAPITEINTPIYNPVSMSTKNPELAPIISVVQKSLNTGALYHLIELYNQGHKKYYTYRFHASLSEEEMAYITARDGSRGDIKPIPFIMEKDNYPWAFYDENEQAWQGIAWDVLKEIESISGLRFKIVSSKDDTWSDNLAQLETGGGAFVSRLIRTNDRKDHFLWTENPYAKDNFAFISKREMPDLEINEVLYAKVGLICNSAYMEYFQLWFPNHPNTMEFLTRAEALTALEKGEIDLYMGTRDTLLHLTNYLEEPRYKLNLIFNQAADSYFGFNRNEQLLCSVIDKAQILVNTKLLESRWLTRTFDYRTKLLRATQPYLIGFSVLLAVVILLLIALLQKYRESRQQLKVMVKRRTQELEIQKNIAQAAYRVKNRFLANMSHEFRTPLNAILGLSLAELEKSPAQESKDNLTSINRSGTVLLGIINDLLDISNIESGDMQLKDSDYLLPMLINSTAAAAKLKTDNKGIDFHLEADECLPLKLHGDMQRIKQIVGNLLSNAVKFTNEGSIFFRIGFEAQAESDQLMLIFEVCDTGIGIRSEDMENIFSDYGQIDTETNRSAGGVGMGLLITKRLAKLMGGDVNVVSEYEKGSIFTAWIPQKISDDTIIGSDIAEKLRTFSWNETLEQRPCLSYARVLIVDDVLTNHAVARGIMRPYKMTIDAVLSGQDAIDLIAKAEVTYDTIFMDHMMPGMDGVEATRHIRELGTDYAKNIPIIALTANALTGNEEFFLANGFNAYVIKPINVNVLNSVLLKWVRDAKKESLLEEKTLTDNELSLSGILKSYTIEGVDLAAGAAQFGGEENYLEIIKVFVADTPKLLEDIQNFKRKFTIMPAAAVAALDALKNYSITVHGIKGSCYGICAAQVGDLAKELEMAAKTQDLNKIMSLNNEFIVATEKLVNELKILFPKKDETEKPKKETPDPALLEKLLCSTQSYNINEMIDLIKELEKYDYEEKNDFVQLLRQAIDNYEYLEVIRLITTNQETKNGDEKNSTEIAG